VKFSGPILDHAHEVRLYRNKLVHGLVHGIPEEERTMTIRLATSHLCTFLSRLPRIGSVQQVQTPPSGRYVIAQFDHQPAPPHLAW
jgi:hypothetical protein